MRGAGCGDSPELPVRLTSSSPGGARLVFRYWNVVAGAFVEDSASQRITSVNPMMMPDVDGDRSLGDGDVAGQEASIHDGCASVCNHSFIRRYRDRYAASSSACSPPRHGGGDERCGFGAGVARVCLRAGVLGRGENVRSGEQFHVTATSHGITLRLK